MNLFETIAAFCGCIRMPRICTIVTELSLRDPLRYLGICGRRYCKSHALDSDHWNGSGKQPSVSSFSNNKYGHDSVTSGKNAFHGPKLNNLRGELIFRNNELIIFRRSNRIAVFNTLRFGINKEKWYMSIINVYMLQWIQVTQKTPINGHCILLVMIMLYVWSQNFGANLCLCFPQFILYSTWICAWQRCSQVTVIFTPL